MDDGRLEVEVEQIDSALGYRVIPNENYLRLHKHSQRAMMYSKLARSQTPNRTQRPSTPNAVRRQNSDTGNYHIFSRSST